MWLFQSDISPSSIIIVWLNVRMHAAIGPIASSILKTTLGPSSQLIKAMPIEHHCSFPSINPASPMVENFPFPAINPPLL
jgi:hypothetical protein